VEERRQLVLDAPVECGLMDWWGSHLPAIRHYRRLYDKPVFVQVQTARVESLNERIGLMSQFENGRLPPPDAEPI
jgi:hypothetical protein